MSAQAGIFYFDGRPIEAHVPLLLDAALADFGPDGGGCHVAPGLVMASRALHVTPEDPLERQPFVSVRGHVMTWDGRLDNRDDLLLQLRRELRGDVTDVAIAMAAYERWGQDAFARLIGDWSVAIFDEGERAVVLASDFMGVRPMYYWRTDECLAWSSSLELLVRVSGRHDDIALDYVFGQLVGMPQPDLSPYRGVVSLSPAHMLVQRGGGPVVTRRFWDTARSSITYSRQAEYAEHLRMVFADAVAARLRSSGPVWCEVSGGLDSSSVACMAHAIVCGRRGGPALQFVSHVTRSSSESDERRFAEEVERFCGVPTRYLVYEDYPRVHNGHWLMPVSRAPILAQTAREMAGHGARVALTGRVGDGTMGNFTSDGGSLAQQLARGRMLAFMSGAREWSRASHDPIVFVIAQAIHRLLPRRPSAPRPLDTFSLTPRFAREHLARLTRSRDLELGPGSAGSLPVVQGVLQYSRLRRLQTFWWTPRVVWSHPFADRRLVEFAAAIPFEVLCPPGCPRALMKSALAGVLPQRILNRFSKGYAAPYLVREVRPVVEELSRRIDHLQVVQREYVDAGQLRARLDALAGGAVTQLGNLLHIAAVEAWLSAHDREFAQPSRSVDVDGITPQRNAVA